jgi:hypothetical protein
MEPSEERSIQIWEQMREIEGELFLLSARSGGLDVKSVQRFDQLCGHRTQLAGELLINGYRSAVLEQGFSEMRT